MDDLPSLDEMKAALIENLHRQGIRLVRDAAFSGETYMIGGAVSLESLAAAALRARSSVTEKEG